MKAKTGKFGKVYGKLSPITVMEWMGDYANESMANRSHISEQESDKHKYIAQRASDIAAASASADEERYRAARIQQMQNEVKKSMQKDVEGL